MAEVRMKNLIRMQIQPNRIGAIRDSEIQQLFLNAKSVPRRLEFGHRKRPFFYLDLIYFIQCTAVL